MTAHHAQIETPARRIRAARPRPDLDAMRASYLDLLKLCLCDLTGVTTREVTSDRNKRAFTRELTGGDQLGWRVEGKDWPLDGLTMVGLRRLDDLQLCVETVVRDGVDGDLIEAGVWRGGASILIRATLDSLGGDDRTLWVADSFKGFPAPAEHHVTADRELESHMWEVHFPTSTVEEVRSYFERFGCDRGLRFVAGFFEDTMQGLRGRRWSLIRLDADTYQATRLALEALYPGLARGGYLILDDYFHPLLPDSCRKAVDGFRRERAITEPIEQIDFTGARWRRETDPSPEDFAVSGELDDPRPQPEREMARREAPRVPTDRELQLADEVSALRARLSELQAELRHQPPRR